MKNTISLLTLLVTGIMHSQTVQVNPDGTHTVTTGNVKVNPDGTHTVVHKGEATSVQVNPEGTHTVIHHNETNSIQVNPDGTHTILPKEDRRQSKKKKAEKTVKSRQ